MVEEGYHDNRGENDAQNSDAERDDGKQAVPLHVLLGEPVAVGFVWVWPPALLAVLTGVGVLHVLPGCTGST